MYHHPTMSNPPFRARHEGRSKITPGFTMFTYVLRTLEVKHSHRCFLCTMIAIQSMSDMLHMATSASTYTFPAQHGMVSPNVDS